ncbi:UNVERIFIED_CONTAM: UDP-glycosyltransferase 72B3 [Sesamum radiatum]|uniref:UDP-glycosyltransferase 72B3 n=1 Tax=Sesamum radiatum TaxID=300843 RepID=A0AAW2S781_SESRA
MEVTQRSQPPHNIALLPPPTFLVHLIPFIELAKKLVFHHNCTITLIILDDGSSMKPQKSLLQGLPTAINTVYLPPSPTDGVPENARAELLVSVHLTRSFPALRDTLTSLKQLGNLAATLVVDLFTIDTIDIAKQFEIPAYLFHVIATNELSLSVLLPKLDESCTSE